MEFKKLVFQYALGNFTRDQLPAIAYKGLEEGFDSPSLVILAGIERNESPAVVDRYFELVLIELNIAIPNIKALTIECAILMAEEIIKNNADIIEGISDIFNRALNKYDFFSESKEFAFDSIYFERVNGLYWEYDDLSMAIEAWDEKKSNQDLMGEIKEHLFEELKIWLVNIKSIGAPETQNVVSLRGEKM